jgi:hypothetical protein
MSSRIAYAALTVVLVLALALEVAATFQRRAPAGRRP